MSEYQYYEFRAIERLLTDRDMRELRTISTRAAISRTSFSNHYEYGDLKANPRDLLLNYFDASLYFAHWLYAEVAFKYPKAAVDLKMLRRYAAGQSLQITTKGPHVVVTMSVEREDVDGADDGTNWLSPLIGLRGDIAGGDERPLYVAWLLGVQRGEIDDETLEPTRPDGLGRLSPSLERFVEIVGVDRDLVAAAAEGGTRTPAAPAAHDVDRWLASLDRDEQMALLSRVARGDGSVGAEVLRRYRTHARPQSSGLPLRTAGALRERAERIAKTRREAARQREVRARAQRERQTRAARDRYLAGLARREREAWRQVDALIATKRPRDYDAAVTLLLDLREVSGRKGRAGPFGQRIGELRAAHAAKPSLLARLRKAGF
jgi:hypothetical protein